MTTYARTTPAEAAFARSYTDVLKAETPFKDISEGLTATSGPTYTPAHGEISVEGVRFVEPLPTARWIIHTFNLQGRPSLGQQFYIDNYGDWYGERANAGEGLKRKTDCHVFNKQSWAGASVSTYVCGSCVHPFSNQLIDTVKSFGRSSPMISMMKPLNVKYGTDPLEFFLQPYRELARLERTIYMEKQRKPDYDPTNDTILLRLSTLEKAFKAEKAKVASLEAELEKLKRTTEIGAPSTVDLLGVTETPYVEAPCLEVSDLLVFP